ncbi:MAG: DUF4301 family protein [Bacteroidales bacterium]|nr:DUF4301 family protein [Bacteroidales bacterium]
MQNERIEKQLANYRRGFPYLNVLAAAVPGAGIRCLTEQEQARALEARAAFQGSLVKFVPASGAASRMFKDLFEAKEALEQGATPQMLKPAAQRFLQSLSRFPFYTEALFGKDDLTTSAGCLAALNKVLTQQDGVGYGYGARPKGQILFHRYDGTTVVPETNEALRSQDRTAFEEHLVEAAKYACDQDGVALLHFTASPEHLEGFQTLLETVLPEYEARFGCQYRVSFSTQDPQTDMVAVNEDNTPFLKADGTLLFRPGGHGALLRNLNALDADIAIIKNIDNVVREELLETTIRWKRILTGELIRLRTRCYDYLRRLEAGQVDAAFMSEVVGFLSEAFLIDLSACPADRLKQVLVEKLDRPIRVCGMVKNEGEPGGGPYLIREEDGTTSLQILEGAQLNPDDAQVQAAKAAATHFNPVDLVCSLRRYDGTKYDLEAFVDPMTGFISEKSYEGRVLKAQELPGLWNGSMSRWNTVFVEVPLLTFNPVKTVLDLLRKEHAGA